MIMPIAIPVSTVITAAGDSRKLFMEAGFGRPKSLVKWQGREVLARAIDSYATDPVRATVAINWDENVEWGLSEWLKELFPQTTVYTVPSSVKGALATALIGLANIELDSPLVVAAGDSMVEGGIEQYITQFVHGDYDAASIAFPSTNPRWSYLAVDAEGSVRQVAEKQVIGTHATTGVFYFRSARLFLDAATWCLVNNASHKGLFYVSTTLNFLISNGMRVGYERIPRSMYQSWSLPIDFTGQCD